MKKIILILTISFYSTIPFAAEVTIEMLNKRADGQIMVLHDVLGVSPITPKFVKNFLANSLQGIPGALVSYAEAVKNKTFPASEHCFK